MSATWKDLYLLPVNVSRVRGNKTPEITSEVETYNSNTSPEKIRKLKNLINESESINGATNLWLYSDDKEVAFDAYSKVVVHQNAKAKPAKIYLIAAAIKTRKQK